MEKNIPNHVAIIMDGNGRWAKKRGLARSFGHMEGAKSLRKALFLKYIKSERKNMMKNGIRFYVSGRKNNIPKNLSEEIDRLQEDTKTNNKITLNIAFNYGGRAEIIDAIKKMSNADIENLDENNFSQFLYNDFPDPDLVIRTSGEFRISNFLLWQIAYSEFYVTDTLWPDFDKTEIDKAIDSYNKRDRRFGGVKNV